jgi:type IV secretory pathway VirB10-like protein
MPSNRLTFVGVAIACIFAAGVGGYFATRQNAVPAPAAAAAPVASTLPDSATTPPRPVAETEAVVGDTPKPQAEPAAAAAAAAKPQSAPAKRAEAAKPAAPAKSAATTVAKREAPPSLDRPWPARASSSPQEGAIPEAASKADERLGSPEPARTPEPPQKTFQELVLSANSVIGLQTETRLSSETARVEDRVEARVTRDVKVGNEIAIPAGSRAIGSVIQVERGGKFKERARLGIRFKTLVLADGTRLDMNTETIYRDGDAPGNTAAAKVGGGAVGGAILGAILGGAKGAAIGATVGGGAGAGVVEAGDRSAATLPAGTPLTVRLLTPVTVTVEQK